jgi:hypothetical protein
LFLPGGGASPMRAAFIGANPPISDNSRPQ